MHHLTIAMPCPKAPQNMSRACSTAGAEKTPSSLLAAMSCASTLPCAACQAACAASYVRCLCVHVASQLHRKPTLAR